MNELKDVISFLAKSGVISWSDIVENDSSNDSIKDTSPKWVEGTSPQYTEEIDDSIVEKLNALRTLVDNLKLCIFSGGKTSETSVSYGVKDAVYMLEIAKKSLSILDEVLERIKVY